MHLWKPILRRLKVLYSAAGFSKRTLLNNSILRVGCKLGGTKYKGEFAYTTAEGEMLAFCSK